MAVSVSLCSAILLSLPANQVGGPNGVQLSSTRQIFLTVMPLIATALSLVLTNSETGNTPSCVLLLLFSATQHTLWPLPNLSLYRQPNCLYLTLSLTII